GLGALEDLDVGRGRTRHRSSGLRRSFDAGMQFGANLGLVGADGPGELHGVGNDISSGAAVNGADGHDAEFSWILFAADHALYVDDESRRNRNGVDGRVRRRAVTAAAVECHLETVGGGRANPGTIEDRAM